MASLTFDDVCAKLKERENFSMARYGDGEWSCLLGHEGRNCDGVHYDKDLGLMLQACLLEPQTYYMGMQPMAIRLMGDEIATWLKDHNCEIDWFNADILHDASIDGRIPELAHSLRGRRVILVGPRYLNSLANQRGWHQIFVPIKNIWNFYSTVCGDILDELTDKDIVILYVASMMSNVMIAKFAREYKDTITQIDIGSLFDPYLGVRTRRYHGDIIKREFGV